VLDVNLFDQLQIGLATSDDIQNWSHGEVKKPETINYRTLKPEKDGLFCEKIFGPTRDWECNCGKYKRVRFKGIICERCGVEVTRAKVRRERMGHIRLAAPVTHIWYFKGVPSRLGYLLDLSPKDLEKVIYFAAYMITSVDEEARHRDLPSLEARLENEKKAIANRRDDAINRRMQKLEEDLAALEAAEESSAVKKKTRDAAEKEMAERRRRADDEIGRLDRVFDRFRTLQVQDLEGDEQLFREMRDRFGKYFTGDMGAAAIQQRLRDFDLEGEAEKLREIIATGKGQKKTRALKRLKVVSAFLNTTNSPEAMVLEYIPVIPPDLRPMVQLDGGRFATSDLNDLYRRVINRNNRLKRLLDIGAPEIMTNNEKRMLQEAVDALFDNGRRGRPVSGAGNRPLKSLSDMLKGKQGRFRQNLLGKRVDYSGRSVIVVGPQLKLHQCGLPKQMALELFKPFVMKRLVDLNHAQNIKSAKRMVERARPVVWDVLEEVIAEHPVLLNRAPTLHRLGIQAFEPQLIEGKAIQIHPLVCTAFNADFDGDQMAVHLPLSAEAQAEARVLMLSSNNILSPASGRPITTPTQDMVLGIYHLTSEDPEGAGAGRFFTSMAEAMMAFDGGSLSLQAPVTIRLEGENPPDTPDFAIPAGWQPGDPFLLKTTLGRALFNEAMPSEEPFVNSQVDKSALGAIVNRLAERYPKVKVAAVLDALKDLGFYWATRSGVTISIDDVVTPPQKGELLAAAEAEAANRQKAFERGLLTEGELDAELIEIWERATSEVSKAMQDNYPTENPIWKMVKSGARGNMNQMRQIAGMRGLMADPKGETIPRPIKSNFREGLSVLEYFISTHGARKGLADTALRTADSGYLTRRLVDVSQDVIIREVDCGAEAGLNITIGERDANGVLRPDERVEFTAVSRVLATDVVTDDGTVIANRGDEISLSLIDALISAGVEQVKARSVLACESKVSTCATCYGRSLASGKLVDVGEAVGIVAAQSIGEPGTQLTMRTFHTGGVAGEDITSGLPRVVELFEARTPRGVAQISEATGTVTVSDVLATEIAGRVSIKIGADGDTRVITVTPEEGEPVAYEVTRGRTLAVAKEMWVHEGQSLTQNRIVTVAPDDGSEAKEYEVGSRQRLLVETGDRVKAGEPLTSGPLDPKEVARILGSRGAQKHLVDEVQKVYRPQGVSIHDKHIEVIVRQMLRRVIILDPGDSEYLTGEMVDSTLFREENQRVLREGGRPARGRPELMGITKASLATDSWLSAASFQETTRVLTDAAINAKRDPLIGLKENVILGKLIPAGTGLSLYRDVKVEPTEEAKAQLYSSITVYDDVDYGFSSGAGEAVPLEEFDYGRSGDSDFR
jgi:DNA-directed RNA polymerase subunit beta'